jgi:DNA polymerase-1
MYSSTPTLDDFREVVLLDTEFVARDGDRVLPVCLVAHELRSGHRHRVFFNDPHATHENPLPVGSDVLYVAYAAQAEWKVFLALGWSLPEHILDLFAEFRCATNGLTKVDGSPVESSMIAALMHYGLDSMTVVEKQSIRDLILRGHPYPPEEQQSILDYCSQDFEALEKLLPAMLPGISLPYPIFRGRYTKAVASMEFSGIPIDVMTLRRLESQWEVLKEKLAGDVEAEYRFGVYGGTSWSNDRFEVLLDRLGILGEWPRTPTGLLSTDDEDVFEPMAMRFPALAPLRDLRSTLTHLRQLKVTVGADGRNRCSLMPFRSVTGRNYPPSSKFIFGPSTWIRSLIKPEPGRAIAYIDWASAEFGIAAALSGDMRMKAAYESGDIYMFFAIEAGAAPKGATKATHREIRDLYKTVVLAVQYGQTAVGLAKKLGEPIWRAQELLNFHRRLYSRYWEWSEWMSQSAIFGRKIETVFCWPMFVTSRTKPNTISNYPMQANGSEMLRWACTFATERGVEIHAPVQDALLVGGPIDEVENVVSATQEAMAQASDLVLDGFILRTDTKIVRFPDRYSDERGAAMWRRVMRLLDELEPHAPEIVTNSSLRGAA